MTFGKSPTLEPAVTRRDLPIPLLYQELDITYPGSKFILTVRSEDRWINSVRAHWSDANPFRAAWDTDPFTHQVHTLLYGRRKFDETVFRERYRRHNAEVLHYFRDRPNDLLVMDMDDGAGWGELCGFLRRSIPASPYPRSFCVLCKLERLKSCLHIRFGNWLAALSTNSSPTGIGWRFIPDQSRICRSARVRPNSPTRPRDSLITSRHRSPPRRIALRFRRWHRPGG